MYGRGSSTPHLSSPRRPASPAPSRVLPFLLLLLLAGPAPAQRQKPNIADEVEDRKAPAREADPRPAKEARPVARRGGGGAPPRRPAAPATLAVTLQTGQPGTEVFLGRDPASGQRLGRSGADGRLLARLPRGRHTVSAVRDGARAVSQQIDVQPGRTTFTLDPEGAGAGADEGAAPSASTADEVFKRFLDPRRTDGVTLADWQLAEAQTAAAYQQNSVDPLNAAQAMFARGQVAFLRGDSATALVAFNQAALTLPKSALAFYGLGNAYVATGQLGEAARAYQQAARLNREWALPHRGLGDVLSKQGKEKEALVYYEAARARGYTSAALEQSMARSLLRQKQWRKALDLLLAVTKSNPSAEAYVGLGDAYAALKQPLSAAGAYREATRRDPKSAFAHFKYGELSYQMREYAAALEALERALALDPSGVSFNRARAREMADDAARRLSRKD